MKLARRAIDDPERRNELKASLDDKVSELVAEANDAGYGTDETMEALLSVVQNQAVIAAEDPDPADDPSGDVRVPDRNTGRNDDPHPLDPRPESVA